MNRRPRYSKRAKLGPQELPLIEGRSIDCIGERGVRNGGGLMPDSQGVRLVSLARGKYEEKIDAEFAADTTLFNHDPAKVRKVSLARFSWDKPKEPSE